jgi:2-keto-4-pentenoate hydratase/2-oxohepta-3-ene-1,7-dioic acid hydratase in catechol pathway
MPRAPIEHVARYLAGGAARVGRVEGDHFLRLTAPPWAGGVESGERDPIAAATLLPPVEPGKIVCVGLNYESHIAESLTVVPGATPPEEPLIFLKPSSSVIASGDSIRYPPGVTRLDPEAELAVVIGRRARRTSLEEAPRHIAGLTAFNDVSARNYQKLDGQWTRAKGFDTFAPLGPWVTTGLSPEHLEITCRVNGETRQRGNTADLRFPVAVLIHFVSQIMTLEPGDVIATGTPAGIAPIRVGDVVEVEVEGVGVLRNSVAEWGD